MSRGGGARESYLKWLAKMIDISLRHNPEGTRVLLAEKLHPIVAVPDSPVTVPVGTESGSSDRG